MSRTILQEGHDRKNDAGEVGAAGAGVRVRTVALPNEHGGWGLRSNPSRSACWSRRRLRASFSPSPRSARFSRVTRSRSRREIAGAGDASRARRSQNACVETFGLGAGEEFPILEVAPASFVGSLNGMARQVISQGDGSPLVEEELHH